MPALGAFPAPSAGPPEGDVLCHPTVSPAWGRDVPSQEHPGLGAQALPGTPAGGRELPPAGSRPGKTTGSVCIGRSPRLILRGSFSSDLIWTAALPINHSLMRTIHLPALAFNKTEEDWSPSRS